MASIQPNITDLDDLLIQASDIDDNGTDTISITTTVDASSVISVSDTIVIMGTGTALDGSWTVATITGTAITVSNTTGGALANQVGQIIVDNADGTYDTLEININCVSATPTFTLKSAGNLSVDGTGVTGQGLYSFFKYVWKNVTSITKYNFPMLSITNEQFEFIDGWEPIDDTTRKKLRTCGWSETTSGGVSKRKFFGFVSLGTLGESDQPYYVQSSAFNATSDTTVFTGQANEPIKFYEDTNADGTPDFDYKGNFKVFVRTRKKTYTSSQIADIGVSELTYIVYRFPLSNSDDLNINTTDDNAFSGATISTISGDGTTVTITTSANHGLYAGAPITIDGNANGWDGDYVVDALDETTPLVKFTVKSTVNVTADGGGSTFLGYCETSTPRITMSYLENPYTNSGDVVIKGLYLDASTYNPGDVVYDATGWYYLNQVGDSTGGTDDTIANSSGTWASWTDGIRDIEQDGTESAYTAVLDLNATNTLPLATKEVAYEWAQYKLRLASNINSNASSSERFGNIADDIVYFVGSQLHTNALKDNTPPFAVVVDDIADADVNRITYHDYADGTHLAPTVVTVTINFNSNLAYAGTDAIFYAYYTGGTNPFGTTGATQVVKSNSTNVGADVQNKVPVSGTYTFSYAYTSDTTNGRTGDSITSITIVAIGLEKGQYVTAEGNITANGGSFSLVAPLERNYDNPA